MKRVMSLIILALLVVCALSAVFAAAASSAPNLGKSAPVCDGCGNPMELVNAANDHCDWQCVMLGCPKSGEIISLPHSPVTDAAVEPTCTKPGKTAGSHCRYCDSVLTKQEEIPPLGHKPVTDAAVEPTCTEPGRTEGSHCQTCGVTIVKPESVPPLGHTPVTDAAIEPTCTEQGKTEGSHCQTCGVVLTSPENVPALGHDYKVEKINKPTCTANGKETDICARCGDIKETVLSSGHQYENITFIGRRFKVCARCGNVMNDTSEDAEAKTDSDKVRLIIDELIRNSIADRYGKNIDADTVLRFFECDSNLLQLCIDETAPDSKTLDLFKLPIFAVVPVAGKPDTESSEPVKLMIPLKGVDINDQADFSMIFITGKDEFEVTDGKFVDENYLFETRKPGILAAVKTSMLEEATRRIREIKTDK